MRVRLLRDVTVTIQRGTVLYAQPDIGQQVTVSYGGSRVTLPAEFYELIRIVTPDGTELEEGCVYDIAYTQPYGRNKGRVKTLRGWEVLGTGRWGSIAEKAVMLRHRGGSSYLGKSQEIDLASIKSAVKVTPPKDEE